MGGRTDMIDAVALTCIGIASSWARPLNDAMGQYEIDTLAREAMFVAQCAHESAGFAVLVENLNYGPAGLLATWPKHFSPEQAVDYAHDPERIANRAYCFRNGNGAEDSGDGWKYRGHGLIQITGRSNYEACGRSFGVNLLESPDDLTDPTYACLSAAWFWRRAGCNQLADAGNFIGTTRRINGGTNGQPDRERWLRKVKGAMQ